MLEALLRKWKTPVWPAEDSPFFATRIGIGAALGIFIGAGPLLFQSNGIFIVPIAADTGWNRGTIASAIGATSIVLGLMAPVTGLLVDRFKPRRLSALSMPSIGLGLVMVGLIPHTISAFFMMMVVAAILAAGQEPQPYAYLVTGWFERRRGLLLGIALSFTGVALAVVATAATALISRIGWRMTYVTLGCVVAIVGLAAPLWFIVDPPERERLHPETAGLTWQQAIRTGRFWLMAVAFTMIAASVACGLIYLPVLVSERGASGTIAGSALGIVGLVTIAARVSFGFFLDRFFAPRLAGLVFTAPALALFLPMFSQSPWVIVASALFLGIGIGVEFDAFSYIAARSFGLRHFGRIFGLFVMGVGIGGGLAPMGVARLRMSFGSFAPALAVAGIAAAISSLLVLLLRRKDLPFSIVKERTALQVAARAEPSPQRMNV